MRKNTVIFDLDGVIVSTDVLHFRAWKEIADAQGIEFSYQDNHALRGVSRMASLEIILNKTQRPYSDEEKAVLCEQKNNRYRALLESLGQNDILPGVGKLLHILKALRVSVAIASSSKNAPLILQQIGLLPTFDAVVDGNMIHNSKPSPEVFLTTARLLGKRPEECVVVEDAAVGVEAAIRAGMKVTGVGSAQHDPRATLTAYDIAHLSVDELLS